MSDGRASAAGGAPRSAADCLRRAKAELLDEWERRVRADLPAARGKGRAFLINSLPRFLDEMIASLERERPELSRGEDTAEEHATQRSTVADYDLRQVLDEYRILRHVLFERLDREVELTPRERDVVLEVLQNGTATSAERWTKLVRDREARVAHALRETEDRLDLALRAARMGVWDWDLRTGELTWSDRLKELWAYGPGEFPGTIDGFWARTHPDDRAHVEQALRSAVERRDRYDVELRVVWPDGSVHWIASKGEAIVDEAGEATHMVGVAVEVTDRVAIEQDLRRAADAQALSERSFRTLAESMPQIVWTARPDGFVDWYNQWWYDYTGAKRGSHWDDPGSPMHPDDVDRTWERWKRSLETGELYEIEYRFKRASDGQYRWHIGRAVPMRDDAGRIVRWIGTNTDIHEQKVLLEELRSTQQRLELALRASKVGVFDHDLVTDAVDWTPEQAEIFGFGRDRLRVTHDELVARIHPDDRDAREREIADAGEHDRDYRTEYRVLGPDGSLRWVFGTGRVTRDEHGRPIRVVGASLDVTERKEQEQALAQALQTVQDFKFALDTSSIVATTDARGVITYVNDKFCEISKYARGELIGKTHAIINSGHHPRAFFQDLWRTIGSGRVWRGEIKNRAKDGSFYWVDTVIVPFVKDGRPVQYIAIRNDITERMRALEELREERELRERFVSTLTHDLRTPLTTARTSAQLIARRADDADRVIALSSKAVDALDRADKMIQDLLDVTRIAAGSGLALELSPCDLVPIAREVCDDMSVAYGAEIRVHAPPSLEGCWSCNELRRVLENLVSNACKYGEPQRTIDVTLWRSDEHAHLSVHNFGPMIPEDEQRSIFESFRRSGRARSRAKGWGIGLSLVKGVVDAHRGEISLRSDEHDGTTFSIRLPLDARASRPTAD